MKKVFNLFLPLLSILIFLNTSCSGFIKKNVSNICVMIPSNIGRAVYTKEEAKAFDITLYTDLEKVYKKISIKQGNVAEFENVPFGKYKIIIKAVNNLNKTVAVGKSELFTVESSETVFVTIKMVLNQYFNINYELDGGINSKENPSIYTFDEEFILKDAVKENYIFDGWYLDNSLQNEIKKLDSLINNDVTLFAKWKEKLEFLESVPQSGTYYVLDSTDLLKISTWANSGASFGSVTFVLKIILNFPVNKLGNLLVMEIMVV